MCWSELAALSVLLYGGPFLPGKVKKKSKRNVGHDGNKNAKKKKKNWYLLMFSHQKLDYKFGFQSRNYEIK